MNIKDYYNHSPEQEWERLDINEFEFAMTKYILSKHIFRNAKVLDIGGGPGRYSLFLAERGNDVTLFDISNTNIEFAKNKAEELNVNIKEYITGDVLDLIDLTNNKFDAILCMGPLYHLLNEEDRRKAINNCLESLTVSGILICTFISKYAKLSNLPNKILPVLTDSESALCFDKSIKNAVSVIEKQINDNNTFYVRDSKISVAQVNPEKISKYMKTFGLKTLFFGVIEGVFENSKVTKNLPEHIVQSILNLNYKTSQMPVMWGNGSHFIYIGKKR